MQRRIQGILVGGRNNLQKVWHEDVRQSGRLRRELSCTDCFCKPALERGRVRTVEVEPANKTKPSIGKQEKNDEWVGAARNREDLTSWTVSDTCMLVWGGGGAGDEFRGKAGGCPSG